MGKYRGKDGWLQDDSANKPTRYQNSENVQKPATPEKKKRKSCPNCQMGHCWRREEGYCTSCGWGSPQEEEISDSKGVVYCCSSAVTLIVFPLLGMGMGYGAGGFAGLIVGLALGLAAPCSLFAYAVMINKPKEK